MNELFQIIVLSIIQGITEFLPISSSAHLILIPSILGWSDQGIFFDVSMHFGSLLAVSYYFLRYENKLTNTEFPLNYLCKEKIIIGSFPVLFFGFIFYDHISSNLRSIEIISIFTILIALVLLMVEYFGKNKKDITDITNIDILIIGLFQSIALIPGTSRSAIIIIGALLLGYNKKSSIVIALILAFPVILLAMLYEIYLFDFQLINIDIVSKSIIAIVISFLVSFYVIKYFIYYINKTGFYPFMIYRIILGVFLLVFFIQ